MNDKDNVATILIPFCYFISGLFGYVISRDIFSRVLGFASGFVSRILLCWVVYIPRQSNSSLTCLRHVCLSLKWATKVTVKELFTRIWIASLGEVPVLFSSGRKVLYGSLPLDEFGTSFCFPQGGKSSICIVRCCSTSLERRAVFLGEESLLFESFVATRRVWNVVPFSSGRKNIVCLSALNWTSCFCFSRENILLFVLF